MPIAPDPLFLLHLVPNVQCIRFEVNIPQQINAICFADPCAAVVTGKQGKIKDASFREALYNRLPVLSDIFCMGLPVFLYRNFRHSHIEARICLDVLAWLHSIVQSAGQTGEHVFDHALSISLVFLLINPFLDNIRLQRDKLILPQDRLDVAFNLATLISDGLKIRPALSYSALAFVPSAMASALVRYPPFEIGCRLPLIRAPSKDHSHFLPRFLVRNSPMLSSPFLAGQGVDQEMIDVSNFGLIGIYSISSKTIFIYGTLDFLQDH